MARLELVRSDYGYPLTFTIKDAQENVVDLTNATVQLKIKKPGTIGFIVNAQCDIDADPTTGICTYNVAQGAFSAVGRYSGELEITWSGSKVMTATDLYIDIVPDLTSGA